jgi:hypothetical protein
VWFSVKCGLQGQNESRKKNKIKKGGKPVEWKQMVVENEKQERLRQTRQRDAGVAKHSEGELRGRGGGEQRWEEREETEVVKTGEERDGYR